MLGLNDGHLLVGAGATTEGRGLWGVRPHMGGIQVIGALLTAELLSCLGSWTRS